MEKSKALNVFPIEIEIIGKDAKIEGQIVRTKAPRTVERILSKLPVTGKASKRNNQLNLPIDIKMDSPLFVFHRYSFTVNKLSHYMNHIIIVCLKGLFVRS